MYIIENDVEKIIKKILEDIKKFGLLEEFLDN